MALHWQVIYTTAGLGQATIVKSLLDSAGIPTELSQEGAGAAFGFTVGALGLVDVLVPEDRAAEAEAILAAMQRGELDDDSEGYGGSSPTPPD
jgi:hypothetical protein